MIVGIVMGTFLGLIAKDEESLKQFWEGRSKPGDLESGQKKGKGLQSSDACNDERAGTPGEKPAEIPGEGQDGGLGLPWCRAWGENSGIHL